MELAGQELGRKVMTCPGTKYVLGYAALAIVAWILLPNLIALLLIVGVPVAGYLMLDPSQRRRLKQAGRRELGPLSRSRLATLGR